MHKKILLAAIALSTVLASAVAYSAEDPAVEAREKAMKTMGKNMKAMMKMAKGETPFDAAQFTEHAKAVAGEANKDLVALFPADTDMGTDAKPEIWTNMDDFKARAADLKEKANALVAAAETGDQAKMTAAQGDVGKVCGGCHKKYKED